MFCRFQFWSGVTGYQPSAVNDFGRTVTHHPENIERQDEKESDSVEIKFNSHLMIDFRLIKGIGDDFRVITNGPRAGPHRILGEQKDMFAPPFLDGGVTAPLLPLFHRPFPDTIPVPPPISNTWRFFFAADAVIICRLVERLSVAYGISLAQLLLRK